MRRAIGRAGLLNIYRSLSFFLFFPPSRYLVTPHLHSHLHLMIGRIRDGAAQFWLVRLRYQPWLRRTNIADEEIYLVSGFILIYDLDNT